VKAYERVLDARAAVQAELGDVVRGGRVVEEQDAARIAVGLELGRRLRQAGKLGRGGWRKAE
jgi:hypothetical protein